MKKASGRACAKFILLGEHFVVHGGVPALSFPIRELWTEVTLCQSDSGSKNFSATFLNRDGTETILPKVEAQMSEAVEIAWRDLGFLNTASPLNITSKCNFPISRGFGSSASFSVALMKATQSYFSDSNFSVEASVHALEKLFHGNPSGVDAATILSEKAIRFEKGCASPLPDQKAVDFVLLNVGERVGCKELVANISTDRKLKPHLWEERVETMMDITRRCLLALETHDTAEIAHSVNDAHIVLKSMGLSTPLIENAIEEGMKLGALGGKVSGAGAGGATILITKAGAGGDIARQMLERGFDVLAVENAYGK